MLPGGPGWEDIGVPQATRAQNIKIHYMGPGTGESALYAMLEDSILCDGILPPLILYAVKILFLYQS